MGVRSVLLLDLAMYSSRAASERALGCTLPPGEHDTSGWTLLLGAGGQWVALHSQQVVA